MLMTTDLGFPFPRRNRVDKLTTPETAIRAAILQVEAVGASVELTDAVLLLGQAQARLADHVDRELAAGMQEVFCSQCGVSKGLLAPRLDAVCNACAKAGQCDDWFPAGMARITADTFQQFCATGGFRDIILRCSQPAGHAGNHQASGLSGVYQWP